ncbi:TetR/AcrR family transcriptional regulator C-terminal ligand-binding domain-containing protein [Kitasatospora fiedleri]|uniref:TetR/AcrR family transcriptional regulator C-terminal ligand-binding domain-containing protein n=1 Tax=Kitasatospora fiedleri TaxID=2991545 RepID=UPI00249BE9F3|nr:TetR/AcrR family transcriptional regulator C-terminal ligand-binding domain-containing protein [Kitasatospora fiedleri]
MTQATGTSRPGGRTARTREAVHAATRELLAESADGTVELAEVAARSGVHVATLYRRWRTADGLIIDTVVEELGRRSPLPATGDLRADLLGWTSRLLAELGEPGHLAFFRAMLRAGDQGEHGLDFVEPRIRQLQATLDAAGATVLTWGDVFELILAPAYVRALLASPMDPATDAPRLVDNIIAIRTARERARLD